MVQVERSVAVVDDDPDITAAICEEVHRAGWDGVAFNTVADAISEARRPGFPRFVLMDLELPGEDAIAAIAAFTEPSSGRSLVALTGHAGDDFVFRALRAGAVGYVLKSQGLGQIATVLSEVASGGAPMSPSIARRVVATFRGNRGDPPTVLTHRERDVLEALGKGFTYRGVADVLGISVDTVRQHVRNLYRKLHASSKAEAIAVAMRHGWID